MALSFTIQGSGTASSSTYSVTLGSATLAGDIIMVGSTFGLAANLVSVVATGSFTQSTGGIVASGGIGNNFVGAFLSPTAGTTAVTINLDAVSFGDVFAVVVSGFQAGTCSLDQLARATGTSTNADSGASGALAQTTEAALGYFGTTQGFSSNSAGPGWTGLADLSFTGGFAEYMATVSSSGIDATAVQSVSGSWFAWAMTVKGTLSGGSTVTAILMSTPSAYFTRRVTTVTY